MGVGVQAGTSQVVKLYVAGRVKLALDVDVAQKVVSFWYVPTVQGREAPYFKQHSSCRLMQPISIIDTCAEEKQHFGC